MKEDEAYRKAKVKAKKLRGFYNNLIAFLMVNAILFVINLVTSRGYWWFYWVTIFWGLALVIHAIATFTPANLDEDWEEKKAQEIMEKEKKEGK